MGRQSASETMGARLPERFLDLADARDVFVRALQAAVHRVDGEVRRPQRRPLFARLAPLVGGAGAGVDAGLDAVAVPRLAGSLAPRLHLLERGRPAAIERALREEPVR